MVLMFLYDLEFYILPLHCQVTFHRFSIETFVFDLVNTNLNSEKEVLLNILTRIKANKKCCNRRITNIAVNV